MPSRFLLRSLPKIQAIRCRKLLKVLLWCLYTHKMIVRNTTERADVQEELSMARIAAALKCLWYQAVWAAYCSYEKRVLLLASQAA